MNIVLPWPPKALSPNARQHWAALANAKRAYRRACAWQAAEQGVRHTPAEKIAMSLVFVPPDRRRRDWDNLIASMKAGLDGLADVLGVDDSRFRITSELAEGPGGFVRVGIEVLA